MSKSGPVNPQLSQVYNKSKHKITDNWYISEKYDGLRAIWDGYDLYTRSMRKWSYVPQWFVDLLPVGIKFDGEILIPNCNFSDFSTMTIQHQCDELDEKWKKVVYMVFDYPLDNMEFHKRLELLKFYIPKENKTIKLVNFKKTNDIQTIDNEFKKITKNGGEGIMLIKADSLYMEGKRPSHSLKYKKNQEGEATVIDILEGTGKYKSMMGKIKCQLSNGKTFLCGTGFTDKHRNMYHFDNGNLTLKTYNKNDENTIEVPKIGDTITYSCMEFTTKTGVPRMSVYKGIRTDLIK